MESVKRAFLVKNNDFYVKIKTLLDTLIGIISLHWVVADAANISFVIFNDARHRSPA